jgi:hypothetical protein
MSPFNALAPELVWGLFTRGLGLIFLISFASLAGQIVNRAGLEPVPLAQHLATGEWWKRSYVGPHLPPCEHDAEFWEQFFPEPEMWHFDAIAWRRRCPKLRRLMQRARAGTHDPMQLVLEGAEGLGAIDLARFWDELVVMVGPDKRLDLATLPDLVEALRKRWDNQQRRALHRLLGRFSLCLVARLEPLYLGRGGKPLIQPKSYFHLWMLAAHIIGNGREAYLRAMAGPLTAAEDLPSMTPQSGLYYLSIFRFEAMVFDAQKLRLVAATLTPSAPVFAAEQSEPQAAGALFGISWIMPCLRESFRGPRFDHSYPERYPTFSQLASGEVVVSAYASQRASRR